nr:PREDICTED: cytochrome P450 2J2-like [Rhinolophus sinicus]
MIDQYLAAKVNELKPHASTWRDLKHRRGRGGARGDTGSSGLAARTVPEGPGLSPLQTAVELVDIGAILAAMGCLVAAFWSLLNPRTLLLGAVVFLFLANYFKRRRPNNYPPGPPLLPVVGNLFHMGFKEPHISLQQHVKKYGNILSMEVGRFSTVVITGLPLIKEALVHQDQKFVNRAVTLVRDHIFKNNGLIMSNGQVWKEQRRFALTTLRNFGLGKRSLEERIQDETHHLNQTIEEENGQPFNPHFKINSAVSNIICSITFGERFEYQDDQFQEMLRLLDEVLCLEMSICCHLNNVFPRIMKFIPGPHKTVLVKWEKLKLFIARVIENHRRDWDSDKPRDFIDVYLNEMEKVPEQFDYRRDQICYNTVF